MLVGKTYQTIQPRQKNYGNMSPNKSPIKSFNRTPIPSNPMTSINNLNNKRPLKSNSQNLSFKGLFSLYKEANKGLKGEFIEFTQKHLGSAGKDLLDSVSNSKLAKDMIKVDGDNVTLFKKTIPQLIWDGLIYPIKILPLDIVNGTVELLGKIKPLKTWSEKILAKPFFKNIRQRSKIDAKVNTLRGLFELKTDLATKLKKGEITQEELNSIMFQKKMKMFDPKTGNYDTKHERALNRVVSGLPPAIFLANDAYNLSRMMDDDSKSADKEKKTRFKQEVSRIGLNAYITLVTMGAIQKYINNSKLGIMLMVGSTTLLTESMSRLSNGKYVTRLTPEQARAENAKNNTPEAKIKPVAEKKKDVNFKANDPKNDEKQQKPLLSFSTIMKAFAVVIAGGFAIKGMRQSKSIDDAFKAAFKPFKDFYKKSTEIPEYTITKQKFDDIIKVLEENGFKDMASDYKRVAATTMSKDGLKINLGNRDKRVKPLVDFIIAPFKFAWNTITLPYALTNKVVKMFTKKPPTIKLGLTDKKTIENIIKNYSNEFKLTPEKTVELENFAKNVLANKVLKDSKLSNMEKEFLCRVSNVDAIAKSIDNIGREALKKSFNPENFKTYVKDNTLKAFNVDTMSNVSNSDLSNLAKTAATAATLWFLMTDNYNMVMLKSNGNDKQGADTKFKERFVQEGSRLFYQTLLIDLFNSTFRTQYNKSLMGMSWITLTNTTMGEWLTRKSVGVPIGHHSRTQLLAEEEKINNSKGALKSYYNFMRRLTGKRSIQSYNVKKANPLADPALTSNKIAIDITQPQETSVNFTNNDLTQMIKKGA